MEAKQESPRSRRSYHHGDLRRVLIEATRALVEEKGAAHFSVSEAARRAGVSTAAPYRHFKDREELLDAVAEDGLLRMAIVFEEAVSPYPLGSVDALTSLGVAYVEFATSEPSVFRLMFAEHQNKSEAVHEAGESCKAHLLAQVAARIGCDPKDEAAYFVGFPLWTMVHGISFLQIDGKTGPGTECHPMGTDVPIPQVLRHVISKLMPETVTEA